MTFLSPTNLWLLALLLVIAAAYLLRMPRRRLRVPDAQVARMALAEASRINRQKRTLISLALQVLILLLLALAAALPYLGDTREGNRSLVVLFDTSAGMQADDSAAMLVLADSDVPPARGQSRFEKARAAVKGLSRDMRRGDRMMLMAVGRTVDVVLNFQSDHERIGRALDLLRPTAEEANFADACRLAAAIAKSTPDAEIVLVTDAALRPEDLSPLKDVSGVTVSLVGVGKASANLGIGRFSVRKNLDSPTDYEALVSVVNASDEAREVEVELLLDSAVFDLATVKVPARGETVQVFREKLRVGGVLQARLRIIDALAEDNVAYEILRPPSRLRVLLVSDNQDPGSFLVRAVGSNAGAVEGMAITPEQYESAIAANPSVLRGQRDAVIFDRWMPEEAAELPPTHMLALDCVPPGMPATAGEPFDKPLIRKWEQGHPLMSYMNLRNVFINSARRVDVAEQKKGEPPVERVAEMVTSPLVLAWEREMPDERAADESRAARTRPQRTVVIAFNPSESDIVLRKELPLLLWNSFLWFQEDGEAPTQVAPGETITLDARDLAGADALAVMTPDGKAETAPVDAETGKAFFAATSQAGVYTCRVGETEQRFAVNPVGRFESELDPATDFGFEPKRLDADELAKIRPAGRELWPYLLAFCAAALVFEAIVFHRRVYF